MNDSLSTISPDWPTRWPKGSFAPAATLLVSAVIFAPFALELYLSARNGSAPPPASLPPIFIDFMLALTFVIEAFLALLVLSLLRLISGFSLAQLGFRKLTLSALLTALAGGIVMAIVSNGSASFIDSLLHRPHEQEIVSIFRALHDPFTVGIFALFAVTFAPFAEETIFRVFFFNAGLRYGGFWFGAILSGILFGLAHGDLTFALPLALGGVVLCAVYYRTRNAFASMISHAFFNALSLAALLFAPHVVR